MNVLIGNSNINIITAYLIIMVICYLITALATRKEYGNDLERYFLCMIISIFWLPLFMFALAFIVIYILGMFFDSFMGK